MKNIKKQREINRGKAGNKGHVEEKDRQKDKKKGEKK